MRRLKESYLQMITRIFHAIVAQFRETMSGWSRNQPDLLAAALTYNTAFSLAPLLLLTITIVGQKYREEITTMIVNEVTRAAGPAVAGLVADVLASVELAAAGRTATIVGIVILAWGASGLILRLRYAFNVMWDLVPVEAANAKAGIMAVLKQRFFSVGLVLVIGYILLILLILNTVAMALYQQHLQDMVPALDNAVPGVPPWASILLYVLVFAIAFKVLPQAGIRWRDVWPGALLAALLFWLGNLAIKIYLAFFFSSSIYGVAGSVIVFLLWVYYSAMILLFGARFTQVYADRHGVPIVPDRNMRRR
jgi:membrane protein